MEEILDELGDTDIVICDNLGPKVIKLFTATNFCNKLECLPLTSLSSLA
jgi:hypothetical protein